MNGKGSMNTKMKLRILLDIIGKRLIFTWKIVFGALQYYLSIMSSINDRMDFEINVPYGH